MFARPRGRAFDDRLIHLFEVVVAELDDHVLEVLQVNARVGVRERLARRPATLPHAALAREDALVDLAAVAAVSVAPLAPQGMADLFDGRRHLGQAHHRRRAAVAEREAPPLDLDEA
jgi:hypothetical protein